MSPDKVVAITGSCSAQEHSQTKGKDVSVHSDVSFHSCRSAWACVKYLQMGKAYRS